MAIPKNLKSTDAGAPTLEGQNGALNAVLKWALPQLGWSIIDEDGHRTLFRQGGGPQQYLKIIDDTAIHGGTANATAHEFLYTATDVDSTPHLPATGRYWIHKSGTADTTARPWRIIGNNQFFYLLIDSGSRGGWYCPYYIGTGRPFLPGDIDHFIICGQTFATTAGTQSPSSHEGSGPTPQVNPSNIVIAKGIITGTPHYAGHYTFSANAGFEGPLVNINVNKVYANPHIIFEAATGASYKRVILPGMLVPEGDYRGESGTISITTPIGLREYEIVHLQRQLSGNPLHTQESAFIDVTQDWDDYYAS